MWRMKMQTCSVYTIVLTCYIVTDGGMLSHVQCQGLMSVNFMRNFFETCKIFDNKWGFPVCTILVYVLNKIKMEQGAAPLGADTPELGLVEKNKNNKRK